MSSWPFRSNGTGSGPGTSGHAVSDHRLDDLWHELIFHVLNRIMSRSPSVLRLRGRRIVALV
jgi:hypothetical protein